MANSNKKQTNKHGVIQTCDYACPHVFGFTLNFVKTRTFVYRAANSKKHLLMSMKIMFFSDIFLHKSIPAMLKPGIKGYLLYGARQANLVLIAYASSEGSGLATTFDARSYKQ